MIRSCLVLSAAAALAAQTQPDAPGATVTRVETLIRAKQFAEARNVLDAYLPTHPKSWQALYQAGYVGFVLHSFQPSLDLLARSLAINDRFAASHKILAFDLNILGRKDLAIGELSKAIELDPSSWESRYELGRILYEQGSYVEAVKAFEGVKQLNPALVKTYHNLGLAYAGTGDHAKAVENFEAGLRLNASQTPRSAWPLIDYAAYLNLQSEFDRARQLLTESIGIDGQWAQAYEELSKAYRGLGRASDAIATLQRAVSLNPSKADNHYVLARLYTQTHQDAAARRELAEYERTRQPSR